MNTRYEITLEARNCKPLFGDDYQLACGSLFNFSQWMRECHATEIPLQAGDMIITVTCFTVIDMHRDDNGDTIIEPEEGDDYQFVTPRFEASGISELLRELSIRVKRRR